MADEKVKMGADDIKKVYDNNRVQRNAGGSESNSKLSWKEIQQQKLEKAMIKALESDDDDGGWQDFMKMYKQITQLKMMPQMMQSLSDDRNGNGQQTSEVATLTKRLEEMERRHEEERRNWEREKEKAEADAKIKSLESKIDRLSEIWEKGSKKSDDDPVLAELRAAREEIANMKKQDRDAEEAAFRNDLYAKLEDLQSSYRDLQSYDRKEGGIDDFIRQAEEIEKKKSSIGKMFGFTQQEQEKMSPTELIDYGMKKVPEFAKMTRTVRDVFNPQDYMDDVPTNDQVPAREVTRPEKAIDPEMQSFIRKMKVRSDGAVMDPKGATYTNPNGSLMTMDDVNYYAQTKPGVIRDMIYQFNEGEQIPEQPAPPPDKKEQKPPAKDTGKPKSMVEQTLAKTTPEEPAQPEPTSNDSDNKDSEQSTQVEQEPPAETTQQPLDDRINNYLETGSEQVNEQGQTAFVDKDGVSFMKEDGSFMAKQDLMSEAEANPDQFWNDVQQIRDQTLKQATEEAQNEASEHSSD